MTLTKVVRTCISSRIAGPGLFFIIPVVEEVRKIDMRVLTMDIPAQQVITKDNAVLVVNAIAFVTLAVGDIDCGTF